jgi:SAM-dependent methyltransferase
LEPTEENIRVWDEIHRRREHEQEGLPLRVLERLPNLNGRYVLHLGCGMGNQSLPLELKRGRFDLVYAGAGTLTHVYDLTEFVHGIAGALRPGGGLILFDIHPSRRCLDAILHWREDYFADESSEGLRLWRIGEIAMALADADLRLRAFDEFPGERAFTRFEQRVPAELLVLAERRIR